LFRRGVLALRTSGLAAAAPRVFTCAHLLANLQPGLRGHLPGSTVDRLLPRQLGAFGEAPLAIGGGARHQQTAREARRVSVEQARCPFQPAGGPSWSHLCIIHYAEAAVGFRFAVCDLAGELTLGSCRVPLAACGEGERTDQYCSVVSRTMVPMMGAV
jgi:hypothetical protein